MTKTDKGNRERCNRDAKHYIGFWKHLAPNEPYRVILADVRDKLYETRERCRHMLADGTSDISEEGTYTNAEQVVLLKLIAKYLKFSIAMLTIIYIFSCSLISESMSLGKKASKARKMQRLVG
ncbi:unnamed protein product [Coffea canephora]|uniref:Uncharacterized protein n=1 Tax=Coffea canephora TaxID=49390 RepID=A0A068UBL8_COFCA|nr:unnamed protein product [Coffea canephora]